ncbi:MAG TPA: glycosyltransferase family 1 protein [Candidatus Eisenbacteria bacterium]
MPRPIRVAIDLRPLARGPSTGIGLILTQIQEELVSRGFEFIGLSDRPLGPVSIPDSVEVRVSGGEGGRIRWEARALPRMLRAIHPAPDLYHATWNHGVPAALPFPSLLSLHDLIPWVRPDLVPWPKPAPLHRWLYRRAVTASARNAAAIVTLSEASRRDIVERLHSASPKIEVVPCAVPRWFRPPTPEASAGSRARFGGGPYWLYFGGFDPRKGVDLLVSAMSRAFPDPRQAPPLVLAGTVNPLAERIARSAAERGLDVHLTGYIPDTELSALLGGAELFLYPSRYEGFGIPPLLAMATGVPCVASDAAAIREVVGDAALLFPSGDEAALAALLAAVARDRSSLVPLASRGRERAARFSVEAMAERMIRAYERAASPRGGSA